MRTRTTRAISKPGALLLLDDMVTHRPDMGRPGIEAATRDGILRDLSCSPDTLAALPQAHRFANDGPAKLIALAWCHARFA